MQFKEIDIKMKEIYFNVLPIEETEDVTESRNLFWNSLNSIAAQNISFINGLKTA